MANGVAVLSNNRAVQSGLASSNVVLLLAAGLSAALYSAPQDINNFAIG